MTIDEAIELMRNEKACVLKADVCSSERQPQENGNYLAFYRTSDGTASLEFMKVDHCNAGGGWLHEENGRKAYKKVIAWMPLPERYKI